MDLMDTFIYVYHINIKFVQMDKTPENFSQGYITIYSFIHFC